MTNRKFLAWLEQQGACSSAIARVGKKNLAEVWQTWANPTELIWLVRHSGVITPDELQRLTGRLVRNTPLADERTVWDLLTDERSRAAVVAAETNTVTTEIIEAAWAAESAASAAGSAAWAAGSAAWAAGSAAWAAARSAWAAASAASAASAAGYAAARAAGYAAARAERAAQQWQCDYIREQLPDFVKLFAEKWK